MSVRRLYCIDCGCPLDAPKSGITLRCSPCRRIVRNCANKRWYAKRRKNDPAWKAENARRAKLRRQKIKQLPQAMISPLPSAAATAAGASAPIVPPAPAVRSISPSLCGSDW